MIKALFFDLDGTLLNSRKEITPATRKILKRCKENGVKLFLATARPPLLDRMLSWDERTLALFDGGSYYNGGCVIVGNKRLYTAIPDVVVQSIADDVCRYDTINIALLQEAGITESSGGAA